MSFNFSIFPTQISPAPTGHPIAKDLQVKAVKLTNADFSTTGQAAVKAYLPADSSIVNFRLWIKTQLAGGGITAATIDIGIPGTTQKFVGGANAFGANTTYTAAMQATNIFQVYDPTTPGGDIPIQVNGTSTTGNPTSGEMYLLIEYVR